MGAWGWVLLVAGAWVVVALVLGLALGPRLRRATGQGRAKVAERQDRRDDGRRSA